MKLTKKQKRVLAAIAAGALILSIISPLYLTAAKATEKPELQKATMPEQFVNDERIPGDDIPASGDRVYMTDEELEEAMEDYENYLIEQALITKATRIDNVTISHYCCEKRKHICGTGDGITAMGTHVTPYITVAVDPKVIPLGSEVMIDYGDGDIRYYIAEDIGGAINGKRIDVAVPTHTDACQLGMKYHATVYFIPPQ